MPKEKTAASRTSSSDALFDKLLSPAGGGEGLQISSVFTSLVKPNPRQPRKEIDLDSFELLLASIAAKGIQQPLLVRPVGRSYELVAGQRRLMAAQRLELPEVPVVIRELDDMEALEAAIIENLTREDLNPVDETDSILQLLSLELGKPVGESVTLLNRMQRATRGRTHNVMGAAESAQTSPEAAVVERVFVGLGKMSWASFVQNRLPILSFPEDLLDAVRAGKLSYTKAKELAKLGDDGTRADLLAQVIGSGASVAEVRQLVAARISEGKPNVEEHKELGELRKQLSAKRLDKLDVRRRRQVDTLLTKLRSLLELD